MVDSQKAKAKEVRQMARKKSMFYEPPKHKELAKIVSLESPTQARKSARELKQMFERARSRERRRVIKRATVLAANRAKAARRRKNLSTRERKQYEKIAEIYQRAYKEMRL